MGILNNSTRLQKLRSQWQAFCFKQFLLWYSKSHPHKVLPNHISNIIIIGRLIPFHQCFSCQLYRLSKSIQLSRTHTFYIKKKNEIFYAKLHAIRWNKKRKCKKILFRKYFHRTNFIKRKFTSLLFPWRRKFHPSKLLCGPTRYSSAPLPPTRYFFIRIQVAVKNPYLRSSGLT